MRELKLKIYIKELEKKVDVRSIFFERTIHFSYKDLDKNYRELKDGDKILQFIGLQDKHGKEIYNGFLLSDGMRIYKVCWNQKEACYVIKVWHTEWGWNHRFIRSIYKNELENEFEIVGDIYTNKDLIELEAKCRKKYLVGV